MSKTYVSVALRRLVSERSQRCCEYCLQPEALSFGKHEIDHVVAEKHGGTTTEDNLALACTLCNTFKGSDIASVDPETLELVPLYNPRRDRWSDHFEVNQGRLSALTAVARATIRLLQLNRDDRLKERQLWLQEQ